MAVPVGAPMMAPSGTGATPSGEAGAAPSIVPSLDPLRQATVAAEAGDLEHARALLEGIVAQDPRSAEALTNLGAVLMRLGRAAEAVGPLARAVEIDPARADFRFNYARGLGAAGDWAASVEAYRAAMGLAPDDYPTRFNLARALHEVGREQDALAEYEVARTLNDADGPLHLALGLAYERVGRPADAVQAYRRYLDLVPDPADGAAVRARIERLSSVPTGTSLGTR